MKMTVNCTQFAVNWVEYVVSSAEVALVCMEMMANCIKFAVRWVQFVVSCAEIAAS